MRAEESSEGMESVERMDSHGEEGCRKNGHGNDHSQMWANRSASKIGDALLC